MPAAAAGTASPQHRDADHTLGVARTARLLQPSLRVDLAAVSILALVQVTGIARTAPPGQSGLDGMRLSLIAILAVECALLSLMAFGQQVYWRHRTLAVSAAIILGHAMPSARSVGVGMALSLERPPLPGWRGAVGNWLRAAMGTRMLVALLICIGLPLPPTATLVSRAASTLLTANARLYCTTPLLSHPLAHSRLAAVAAALDVVVLPLAAVQPLAGQVSHSVALRGPDGWATSARTCHAVIAMHHVSLGLVLPVLLAVWSWSPPLDEGDGGGSGSRSKLRHWAQRTSSAGDAALRHLLGGGGSSVARAAVAWYLLCNCWLLCKM